MTQKKLSGPIIDTWFNELNSIILHEAVCYLVNEAAIEEGKEYWDTLQLSKPEWIRMNYVSERVSEFVGLDEDIEAIEFGKASSRVHGAQQAELFLYESDHLIQVSESRNLSDLSELAQYRLYAAYPASIDVIQHCIENTDSGELPSCIRNKKLNEDFRVDDIGFHNNIPKIMEYHLSVISSIEDGKARIIERPTIISAVKRNIFIDIYSKYCDGSIELHTIYKSDQIYKFDEPTRTDILRYCNELVNAHLEIMNNKDRIGDNTSHRALPIPPLQTTLIKRQTQYIPVLVGLYCLQNKSLYERVPGSTTEPKYSSFKRFVKDHLLEKFPVMDSWLEEAKKKG